MKSRCEHRVCSPGTCLIAAAGPSPARMYAGHLPERSSRAQPGSHVCRAHAAGHGSHNVFCTVVTIVQFHGLVGMVMPFQAPGGFIFPENLGNWAWQSSS